MLAGTLNFSVRAAKALNRPICNFWRLAEQKTMLARTLSFSVRAAIAGISFFKVTVQLERCFQFFTCNFVNTHRLPTNLFINGKLMKLSR